MNALSDLDAEQRLLGALLHDNRLLERLPMLTGAHFYEPTHGAIFDKAVAMIRAGRLADAVTLSPWAKEGVSPDIGGAGYLLTLIEAAAPLTIQAVEYARIVRACARRRAVAAAARTVIDGGEEDDPLPALERALAEIAADADDADSWRAIGAAARDAATAAQAGQAKGISTGFERLDAVTGGVQPGTLWAIGGATSMGKSVFGAALSRNVAAQGLGVAEVHLEMDEMQVSLRAAAAGAFTLHGDNPYYLSAARQRLSNAQWARFHEGAQRVGALPIWIDARPGRTLAQIETAARRLFRRMQREGRTPGALLIDHEGLIVSEQRYPSQLEAANARATGLLAMAKRLGVAVIALSQITKEGARADGEDRLPTSQDLNYGGALAQAASVVILLHRKAYYAERKPEHLRTEADWDALRSRETTLVVDKARSGQRSQVQVLMDMPTAAVFEPGRPVAV